KYARLYMSRSAEQRASTIVLAPGKDDRQQINEAIRAARQDRGELGRETEICTLIKSDMTRAERRDAARYQPGVIVEAGRRFMLGPQKGERCEVVGVAKGKVIARMSDGREWKFDPRKTSNFQVYDEARTLRVAEGDRLIARGAIEAEGADGKPVRITNGTALDVVRVTDGGVVVRDNHQQEFEIGRTAQVDYGYALTTHQAQGQEYAHAIAHAESSRENLTSLASLYVTLSRAKDGA
ncbi:TrwC protein, partial [mine drainage metagenome]